MKYEIPKQEYDPYPKGPSEGIIYEIEDKGMIETPFGDKHKLSIKIESLKHKLDDGRPFTIQKLVNLSGHENSDLYKFRCAARGIEVLADDDAYNFDPDELVGIRISYVVEHQQSPRNGKTYGNISSGSVWRLEDQSKGEMQNQAGQETSKDDLPF